MQLSHFENILILLAYSAITEARCLCCSGKLLNALGLGSEARNYELY